MFNSLQPHGLQHTSLPCPSASCGVCSSSCPLHRWCHPTISFSVTLFSFCPQSFPTSGFLQWVRSLHQVAKVLELQLQHLSIQRVFSVYFREDWLVWSPCCPRDSQESSPTPQFKSINSLVLCLLYGPALTTIHDHRKDHSADYTGFCWQSDVFVF